MIPAKAYYLEPGYVCMPVQAVALAAVTASGVVVTLYDPRRRRGGMCHYSHPYRAGRPSTAAFAAPAILCLTDMFSRLGARPGELEAHVYGGAANPGAGRFEAGLSEANVQVGLDLLESLHIVVRGSDLGGTCGRHVVFQAGNGEIATACLNEIAEYHWYPQLSPVAQPPFAMWN